MNLICNFSVADFFFTDVFRKFRETRKDLCISGIAVARNDYLNTFNYEKIIYTADKGWHEESIDLVYLSTIEDEYQFNFSELIHTDRHLFKYIGEDKIKYGQYLIKKILVLLKEKDYGLILSYSLTDFISLFLFRYAKSKGIKFIYFVYARLGDKITFSDRLDTGCYDFKSKFEVNRQLYKSNPENFKETLDLINAYICNKKQPSYMISMLSNGGVLSRFKRYYSTFKKVLNNYSSDKNASNALNPFIFIRSQLIKRVNIRAYEKIRSKHGISLAALKDITYFIYPLHFHPEAATLIQGRWLNNQLLIIEMISKALPANIKLGVKEHRVSVGYRDNAFYKKFLKFHNVVLLDDRLSPYDCLKYCTGLITISSSMGIEALMLNKSIICFGDIHYNYIPEVIKARDITKIKFYISQALKFENYNKIDYAAFLKTILENSFSLPGFSPRNYSKENVKTFVENLNVLCNSI